MSIGFFIYVILLKRHSTLLQATIAEKLYYDNIFGQRFSWVITFEDEVKVRRLFNTIYKSNKSAPEIGDNVDILKIKFFRI